MKYLIMCEGPNEKKIIELLLEHNKLSITYDDLVGRQVYHARQIKTSSVVKTQLKIYGGDVEIWRIGDKQNDKLVIPNDFKMQIKQSPKYILSNLQKKMFCLTRKNIKVKLIFMKNIMEEIYKS